MQQVADLGEKALFARHSGPILARGVVSGTLSFLRASIRVVALLMTAEADNPLVGEPILWVLRLDAV